MKGYILKTPRCIIRELTEADLHAEYELYDSPHMTDFIPPLSDIEHEAQLLKEYAIRFYGDYGYGMWGIFDADTGRLIGEAGLEKRSGVDRAKYPYGWMSDEGCAELGFCIAEDLWGQGYCKEACSAILKYCHAHFGIDTAFARTVEDNVASVHVLEDLGFTVYDRLPDKDGGQIVVYRYNLSFS